MPVDYTTSVDLIPENASGSAGASASAPQATEHRAWMVSKLKDEFLAEKTVQHKGLIFAIRTASAAISALWNTKQALERRSPSDNIKSTKKCLFFYDSNGKRLDGYFDLAKDLNTRDALLAAVDTWYGSNLEKAKRSDMPISPTGFVDESKLTARMVEYDTTPEGKAKSLVLVGGGLLHRNDATKSLIDTKDSITQHSGLGVEIFVVGAKGDIHMASHKIGKYHHSSLLAGENVMLGGEMKVTGGKIDWISNKSGHYHPSQSQLVQFLHFLKKDQVNMDFLVKAGFTKLVENSKANDVITGRAMNKTGEKDIKQSYNYLKTELAVEGFKAETNEDVKEVGVELARLGYEVRGNDIYKEGTKVKWKVALEALRDDLKRRSGNGHTNIQVRQAPTKAEDVTNISWERTFSKK